MDFFSLAIKLRNLLSLAIDLRNLLSLAIELRNLLSLAMELSWEGHDAFAANPRYSSEIISLA